MPKLLCLVWIVAALLTGCVSVPSTAPIKVKMLARNDFHGYLKPPEGGLRIDNPARPGEWLRVPAGGAEHLAYACAGFATTDFDGSPSPYSPPIAAL